jgi:hypothetical protein
VAFLSFTCFLFFFNFNKHFVSCFRQNIWLLRSSQELFAFHRSSQLSHHRAQM